MKQLRAGWLCIAILSCLETAAADTISTYASEKTVFWSLGNGAVLPPGPGQYRYLTYAFADDAHGPADIDSNAQTGPVYERSVAKNLKKDGNVNSDEVILNPNYRWTQNINFNQQQAQTFGVFGAAAQSPFPHADSLGNVTIDYDPTLGVAGLPVAETKISLDGMAEITDPALHSPETVYAESVSAGYVKLTGTIIKGSVTKGGVQTKLQIKGNGSVTSAGFSGAVGSANDPNGQAPKGGYFDPLTLSYYDSLTGDLLASAVILDLDFQSAGDGSVAFSDTAGLTLTSDANGDAQFDIATPSSWVLNGLSGSASLSGGVFQATGDLAAMPWIIQNMGGVTTASLPGLNYDLSLNIAATGLGDPSGDVTAVLTDDAAGNASVYATAPEPAGWVLLLGGMGIIFLGRFRRRATYSRVTVPSE